MVVERPCDRSDLVDGIASGFGDGVDIAAGAVEFGTLGDMGEQQIKEDFAVGVTEDKALEPWGDAFFERIASSPELRDVSVVCKDPVSVLERVRVEDGELPLGGFADVGNDGFRRDDARYTAKKDIGDRGFGGFDDMGRTRDVVPYAPSIGMAFTLSHQRIFGMKKAVVNLAFDHGAESKQSAHRLIPSQTSIRCKIELPRCPTHRCLGIGSTISRSRQLLGRSRRVCIARGFWRMEDV